MTRNYMFVVLLSILFAASATPAYASVQEELIARKTHTGYRDYFRSLTDSEEEDISFILKTLAKKSLIQLLKYKSKLESAGGRIDSIHPLAFLSFIFQDEELKVYFHALKKRGGWVWEEFVGGFKSSLTEESDLNNMGDDIITDFAHSLDLNPAIIYDAIKGYQWDAFIKLLIVNLPREDGGDRYDI